MRYRKLGRTGFEVSELGFGGVGAGKKDYLHWWDPSVEESVQSVEDALNHAVELGVNYFDTAAGFGSEEMYGRALKPHRERVLIATKGQKPDGDGMRASLEASLQRLQTDYVDVFQYRGGWYTDQEVDDMLKPGGIVAGLKALRDEGLTRSIGLSAEGVNGNLSKLVNTGEFDVLQIQYNLFFQHPYDPGKRAGVMFEAEEQGMGIVVMRPFTGGTFDRWVKALDAGILEREDGKRLHQSLLAFALSNPLTDVVTVGMRSASHVEANCEICSEGARFDLDDLYGRFVSIDPGSGQEVWTMSPRK